MRRFSLLSVVAAVVVVCSFVGVRGARAAAGEHWVGTWAASPFAQVNKGGQIAEDMTLREIVHVSLGGSSVRVVLSNEFGAESLKIGAARVGLRATADGVTPNTGGALLFGGKPEVEIPAGAVAVSDAVALKLPAMSELSVSLFVPAQPMTVLTAHGFADQTNYQAAGNQVNAASLEAPTTMFSWRFLKAVEVQGDASAGAIVAFGDSITDGARSTRDANARWPDVLERRLLADKHTGNLGMLNAGIGGNRILHDNTGPNALARFDRDVLGMAGVKYLVVMEGINDIGHAADPNKPYDVISADDLIGGLKQMALRAHAHGIRIYGATLTPYVGAGYSSPAGETMRQTYNDWIRSAKELDGVIDFDKATRDPAGPERLLPANDGGDHLHPSDAGYKAMAESVDVKLFAK